MSNLGFWDYMASPIWLDIFVCVFFLLISFKFILGLYTEEEVEVEEEEDYLLEEDGLLKKNIFLDKKALILLIGLIVYSVFGFAEADTYHYAELFVQMKHLNEATHVEPVHYWIIKNLAFDYWSWRFIIWGAASILTVLTLKRLKIDIICACFFVPLFFLSSFTLTRGNVGLALLFYGVSLFINPSKIPWSSYLLGLVCIASSLFFHRTIFVAIAFLVFMQFRVNKYALVISLALFPLLVNVLEDVLVQIAAGDMLLKNDEMDVTHRAMMFANEERASLNIFGVIQMCLQYGPSLILLLTITVKKILKKVEMPTYIFAFLSYWYAITYFSFLFLFQEGSFSFFSRTIDICIFPKLVVLCWYFFHKYPTTFEKIILGLGVLYCFYNLFYNLWKLPQEGYTFDNYFLFDNFYQFVL